MLRWLRRNGRHSAQCLRHPSTAARSARRAMQQTNRGTSLFQLQAQRLQQIIKSYQRLNPVPFVRQRLHPAAAPPSMGHCLFLALKGVHPRLHRSALGPGLLELLLELLHLGLLLAELVLHPVLLPPDAAVAVAAEHGAEHHPVEEARAAAAVVMVVGLRLRARRRRAAAALGRRRPRPRPRARPSLSRPEPTPTAGAAAGAATAAAGHGRVRNREQGREEERDPRELHR
mmetsp:Transcript_28656/g.66535  ORF Transcript_28656/g.66535 Transcript_28656/m.66535 type:complete len:230 (-) Transcript_28656:74-763(-)